MVPETQDEVVKTVRFCHAEKLPFVARGSGTSLSGGSLPFAGGIVITLNRLNRILRLDLIGRRINVVAGNGTKGHAGDGGPAQAAQYRLRTGASAPAFVRAEPYSSTFTAPLACCSDRIVFKMPTSTTAAWKSQALPSAR